MIIAGAHTDNIPGQNPNGQGSVRIFARPLTGWADADVEDAYFVAPDAAAMSSTPHFGSCVAIDGPNLIVGAPDAQNPSSGAIYTWNVADCGTDPIPGTSLWISLSDGFFDDDPNWIPDSPNAVDRARFVDLGLGPGVPLTVSLTQDETNDGLEVFGGDLLLDLGGGIYELTLVASGPFEEAVIVEDLAGSTAQLTIVNGLLESRTGMIGGSLDSNGAVTVFGADATWLVDEAGGSYSGSLVVGLAGTARLDILAGAVVDAVSVDIGFLGSADGTVHVADPGSRLLADTFIRVGSGVLEVYDGGVVELDLVLGIIVIDPPSTVAGNSTLVGNLILKGLLDPSATADSVGALAIEGSADFRGTVAIDIRDTNDFDTVSVADTAYLGGVLLVSVEFEPALGESFPVLDAAFVETHFDIAFMPGLADGRFMRVEYGPGAVLGGESATIVVEDLDSLFNFGDPESISVSRAPSAVVVGDFDNQDGDDVAIAIPGTDPLDDGTVLVLLNAGTDRTGWLGFASSTAFAVGREPSGLTVGDFNGDGNLDIAVTNSGDDTVSILTNSTKAPGTFGAAVNFAVGDQPSALAAADFGEDANGDTDLVVANAGDDNLYILANDGTGVFSLETVIPTQGSPFAVDPSHLDNDKDVDVIAANLGSDSITIALNTGGGGFGAPMHLAVGDAPVDLVIADLDINGFPDIATANRGDDSAGAGTVSIVLNNGDGTFLPAITLPVGDMAQSLTIIDLEGDDDLDIAIVANDDGGQRVVQVLRNDMFPGSGELIFAEAAELEAGENPLFVTTGDLDENGQDDLITVNEVLAAAANQAGPTDLGSVNVALNAGALRHLPCVWDCGTVDDNVGIDDFLALLGQWGQPGMSCSFNGTAIGIVEFLDLLANWGPYP